MKTYAQIAHRGCKDKATAAPISCNAPLTT